MKEICSQPTLHSLSCTPLLKCILCIVCVLSIDDIDDDTSGEEILKLTQLRIACVRLNFQAMEPYGNEKQQFRLKVDFQAFINIFFFIFRCIAFKGVLFKCVEKWGGG